jgi:6-pyruvoyltetrahydropterin/6-carboxytetrahydropterin synthase
MYTTSKRFRFAASHILTDLPEGHPCARLHGHNYLVDLVLSSEDLDSSGFVIDYRRLDPFRCLLERRFDHRHLNDVLGGQPSEEHVAHWLFRWCLGNLEPDIVRRLMSVRVSQTPSTWAEFTP